MTLPYSECRDKFDEIIECTKNSSENELTSFHDVLQGTLDKAKKFKLFRFSCADYFNIRNFETEELCLSPTGEMNDIYEGIPVCNSIENKTYSKIRQLSRISYIKSFSESCDNVLMWSHYADSNKGICVEYDLSLIDRKNEILKHIYPVLYKSERYVYPEFDEHFEDMVDELKGLEIDIAERYEHDYGGYLDNITPLYLVKAKDWKYEKEWRIIYTRMDMYKEDNESLYQGIIEFPYATAIYLGYRISRTIKENIIEIVERINIKRRARNDGKPDIVVYQMTLSDKFYKLEKKKI